MQSLTVSRSRLVEIQYTVRVSVSSGPLASNVEVELPIHVINFLSVDPPPTAPNMPNKRFRTSPFESGRTVATTLREDTMNPDNLSTSDFRQEEEIKEIHPPWEEDIAPPLNELGNLSINDDTDEVIHQAVSSAAIDSRYAQHGGRFSDLYYSAIPSVPSRSNLTAEVYESAMETRAPLTKAQSYISTPLKSSIASSSDSTPSRKTPKTPNRFPERVQEKLLEANKDGRLGHTLEDSYFPSHSSSLSQSPSPAIAPLPASKSHGSYFRSRDDMPDTVERDLTPVPQPQPPVLSLQSSRSISSLSRSDYFDSVPTSRTSSQTSVESNDKHSPNTNLDISCPSQVIPARTGGQIYGGRHREEFSLPTTRQMRPRSKTSEYSHKEYVASPPVRARSWTTSAEKEETEQVKNAASDSPPMTAGLSVRERIRVLEAQSRGTW